MATANVRHTCKVSGCFVVDSQLGKLSIPALKKRDRKALYSSLADRTEKLGLTKANGEPYNRNDVRNIAYKARLRVEKLLAEKGIKLAEEAT